MQNIFEYINGLAAFANNPDGFAAVMTAYLAMGALTVALRIIASVGYQSALTLFYFCAKDLNSKADLKDTVFRTLNKIVRDYIKAAEKNVSSINIHAIANKHISRLGLLGWSYAGIGKLAAGLEQGALLLGLILAFVYDEYRFAFALVAVAMFLILRLLAAFFDFANVRDRLTDEVAEYVGREVGQFYAGTGDYGAAILRFSGDLQALLKGYGEHMSAQITALNETAARLADVGAGTAKSTETVERQLQYIERNQELLEKTVQQYEVGLVEITKKLGDGLGSIIDYHVQTAYGAINESVQNNLNKIVTSNSELLVRIQQLLENAKRG